MNKMAKTNKLLKKAVKSTYNKLTSIPKQYPKKDPNHLKNSQKIYKMVKFVDNPNKDSKDTSKTPKGKMLKLAARKTPHQIVIQ